MRPACDATLRIESDALIPPPLVLPPSLILTPRNARGPQSEEELGILRQIAIDAPRTEPTVKLFAKSALQRSLIRILYIRACTHPSSGYVQGLNDVLTPFLHVFLSRVFPGDMGTWDVDSIHDDKLIDIEGDCYWCFCKLMDRVEDMYTREQPGEPSSSFPHILPPFFLRPTD